MDPHNPNTGKRDGGKLNSGNQDAGTKVRISVIPRGQEDYTALFQLRALQIQQGHPRAVGGLNSMGYFQQPPAFSRTSPSDPFMQKIARMHQMAGTNC
jgi:hypothetical protein